MLLLSPFLYFSSHGKICCLSTHLREALHLAWDSKNVRDFSSKTPVKITVKIIFHLIIVPVSNKSYFFIQINVHVTKVVRILFPDTFKWWHVFQDERFNNVKHDFCVNKLRLPWNFGCRGPSMKICQGFYNRHPLIVWNITKTLFIVNFDWWVCTFRYLFTFNKVPLRAKSSITINAGSQLEPKILGIGIGTVGWGTKIL